jgi:hypothetical protein
MRIVVSTALCAVPPNSAPQTRNAATATYEDDLCDTPNRMPCNDRVRNL